MNTGIIIKCLMCDNEIYVKPCLVERKRFCSRACLGKYKFLGNKNPRWKGGIPGCKDCGKTLSTRQAIRCREHAVRKAEAHSRWRGNEVSYSALHHWLKRELGSPSICITCGSRDNLQWANKSHDYKRDLEDWLSLCAKCHYQYDRTQDHAIITKTRFPEKFT